MNKLYSTVLALSFVVACSKLEETVKNIDRRDSAQSIEVKTEPNYQKVTSLSDPNGNPCDGPPSIQHLFDGYNGMKGHVDKSGKTVYSVVERVYTVAEAEMQRAREMLNLCEQDPSSSIAQFHYFSANQFAISAMAWMIETMRRVEEPIVSKTDAAKW